MRPDAMDQFVKTLDQVGKQIYNENQKHRNFFGLPSISKEEAMTCWICEAELETKLTIQSY